MAKKLTVIIPCYNVEKYIEQCIDSVLHQTIGIENIQMILIDDSSTDHTLEYLMKYEQKYPENILLWVLEENEGQANARNIGIEHTETEYLAFLDADDWLAEDAYEKLLAAAEKNGSDLVQAGLAKHIEGLEPDIETICEEETSYVFSTVEKRADFLYEHGLTAIWAGVYRTELFSNPDLRFPNFRKYEDCGFTGVLQFQIQSYTALPDILYHYRVVDSSNSHTRNDGRNFVCLEVELEKLKYFQSKGLFEKYYRVIRRQFLQRFYLDMLHVIFFMFDQIPMDRIHVMQVIVRKFFPDYLEAYNDLGGANLLITVAFDLSREQWELVKDIYIRWCSYGDAEGMARLILQMQTALKLT